MSRTDIPMFLQTPDADRPHRADERIDLAGQPGWEAAYGEVCDAVEDQILAGIDADDEDAQAQARDAVADAATNAWSEGASHDEWVSATLRRLR